MTKLLATSLVLLGGWWVLTGTDVRDVTRSPDGAYAYKQSTNALVAGCGPMYTYPQDQSARLSGTVSSVDRVGKPNRLQYPTTVPIFGMFWNTPPVTTDRFWERTDKNIPPPEALMANQWRGDLVVYYTGAVSDAELATLRDVIRLRPDLDIVAVPWDTRARGPLPRGRQVAFATWNASQSCHQFAAPALYDYREDHASQSAPGADGTAPKVISTTPPISVPIAQ